MTKRNHTISHRIVDRKEPKREYRCPACGFTKRLHPGKYWITCGAYEWNMEDVKIAEMVAASVPALLPAIVPKEV